MWYLPWKLQGYDAFIATANIDLLPQHFLYEIKDLQTLIESRVKPNMIVHYEARVTIKVT